MMKFCCNFLGGNAKCWKVHPKLCLALDFSFLLMFLSDITKWCIFSPFRHLLWIVPHLNWYQILFFTLFWEFIFSFSFKTVIFQNFLFNGFLFLLSLHKNLTMFPQSEHFMHIKLGLRFLQWAFYEFIFISFSIL